MKLQQQVSKILKYNIENLGWDESFKRAGIAGSINMSEILKEICKFLDPFIPDIIEKPESVNEQTSIYNPLTEDFSVSYDISGTGAPTRFTIPAKTSAKFDPSLAIHIKKHLINKVLQLRGFDYPTEKLIKEVNVEINQGA